MHLINRYEEITENKASNSYDLASREKKNRIGLKVTAREDKNPVCLLKISFPKKYTAGIIRTPAIIESILPACSVNPKNLYVIHKRI